MSSKYKVPILPVIVVVIFTAFTYPLIVIPVIGVISAILFYINISENNKIRNRQKENNKVYQKRQEYNDIEKSIVEKLKNYNSTLYFREVNDLLMEYAGQLSLLENDNRKQYWSEADYEFYHHNKRIVELINKKYMTLDPSSLILLKKLKEHKFKK